MSHNRLIREARALASGFEPFAAEALAHGGIVNPYSASIVTLRELADALERYTENDSAN